MTTGFPDRMRAWTGCVLLLSACVWGARAHAAVTVRHFPITRETTFDIDANPGAVSSPVGAVGNILSEAADYDLFSLPGIEPAFVEGLFRGDDLAVYFDGRSLNPFLDPGDDNPATQLAGKNFCGFCPDADVEAALLAETAGELSSTFRIGHQLWVKPDLSGFGRQQIVTMDGGGQWGGISITEDGNWAHIWSRNGSIEFTDTGHGVAFGLWSHLAILSAGNRSELWIDGRPANLGLGWHGASGTPFAIGVDARDGHSDPFMGAVDDLKMFVFPVEVGGFVAPWDFDAPPFGVFSDTTGDIDQDGDADSDDYLKWAEHVGFDNGLGAGDPSTLLLGDANENGIVDFADLAIIKKAAQPQPVPEPAALGMFASGGWLLMRRRHCPTAERTAP